MPGGGAGPPRADVDEVPLSGTTSTSIHAHLFRWSRTGFAELQDDESAAELVARVDSQLIDSSPGT